MKTKPLTSPVESGLLLLAALLLLIHPHGHAQILTAATPEPITTTLLFEDHLFASTYQPALTNLGYAHQRFSAGGFSAFTQALASADPLHTLAIVDSIDSGHDFSILTNFVQSGGRAILQYWLLSAGSPLASAFDVAVGQTLFDTTYLVSNWGRSPFFEGLTSPILFVDRTGNGWRKLEPAPGAVAVAGSGSAPATYQAAVVIGNSGRTIVNGIALEDAYANSNAVRLAQNEIEFLATVASIPPPTPTISRQPRSPLVWAAGTNATFSVSAYGALPLSYRWRKEGVPIPAATATTYNIPNVQSNHFGNYDMVVSNRYGSVTSEVAVLQIAAVPRILQPPVSQTVVEGGSVTFSVAITGSPAPFGYAWRQGSRPHASNTVYQLYDFHTLSNAHPTNTGTWRIVIKNVANITSPGENRAFTLTVLADFDRDGLADNWEVAHGLNTNDVADATLDSDGDNLSNLQEYIAGTNPTNAASVLKIDRIIAGNSATLEFQAISNKTYSVQSSENLAGNQWSKLADVLARATNRAETVIDPSAATNRYYRVVTPRQP